MSNNNLNLALKTVLVNRHKPQTICAPANTTTYWIETQASRSHPWGIWKAQYLNETYPQISQVASYKRLANAFSALGVLQEEAMGIYPDTRMSTPTQHSIEELELIKEALLSYLAKAIFDWSETEEKLQIVRGLLKQFDAEYSRLCRRNSCKKR